METNQDLLVRSFKLAHFTTKQRKQFTISDKAVALALLKFSRQIQLHVRRTT